jgi:hypothetical protein
MSTLSQFVGGTPIKSVQRGTISPGFGVSSGTVTISSVTTTKAFANFLGYTNSGTNPFVRINLSSSTGLTWVVGDNASTRVIAWEVIEFV